MQTIFLETDRLILRFLTQADAPLLFELDSDPEVLRFINGGLPPDLNLIVTNYLPRMMRHYQRWESFGFWVAEEKEMGAFLGWFHFLPKPDDPEAINLGFRLKRAAWGKGYATEGSRALIKKGFEELGVQRVVATALAANQASRRVMEKIGMRYIDAFVEEGFPGSDKSAVIYGLERDNYFRVK